MRGGRGLRPLTPGAGHGPPIPSALRDRDRPCLVPADLRGRRRRRPHDERLPARRGPGHGRLPRPRRCAGRCCSRARPASARPRWPRSSRAWTGGELIRLQCYEGIDAAQAVYEWDYGRQLLHLRAAEASGESAGRTTDALEDELYQERFLVKRALLRAIEPREGPPPVLLIDEVDRADDEFEAFLLEVLSDWQITDPRARHVPRRGPAARRAHAATAPATSTTPSSGAASTTGSSTPTSSARSPSCGCGCPEVGEALARQVAAAVAALRELSLYKPPGVAETIDWAAALGRLGVTQLDEQAVGVDARAPS